MVLGILSGVHQYLPPKLTAVASRSFYGKMCVRADVSTGECPTPLAWWQFDVEKDFDMWGNVSRG